MVVKKKKVYLLFGAIILQLYNTVPLTGNCTKVFKSQGTSLQLLVFIHSQRRGFVPSLILGNKLANSVETRVQYAYKCHGNVVALSSHLADSTDQMRTLILGNKWFHLLSHLPDPCNSFPIK